MWAHLVAAGDTGELVAGPDAEDGADGEVGVDDGGAVQGVEGNAEAVALQVHRLRHLLTARELHRALPRQKTAALSRLSYCSVCPYDAPV